MIDFQSCSAEGPPRRFCNSLYLRRLEKKLTLQKCVFFSSGSDALASTVGPSATASCQSPLATCHLQPAKRTL